MIFDLICLGIGMVAFGIYFVVARQLGVERPVKELARLVGLDEEWSVSHTAASRDLTYCTRHLSGERVETAGRHCRILEEPLDWERLPGWK